MGVTEGKWRIKALIILFLFIFSIYLAQGLFMSGDEPNSVKAENMAQEVKKSDTNDVDNVKGIDAISSGFDIIDFLATIIGFLALSNLGLPFYAWLPLMLAVTISAILMIYIMYTFIYEIVKALPLT